MSDYFHHCGKPLAFYSDRHSIFRVNIPEANGGSGNDLLRGGSKADVLNGGEGDDLLIYDPKDLRIDGGAGNDDTLVITQDGKIKLDSSIIDNVEIIDLSGIYNSLFITPRDVNTITSDENRLRINGDSDDTVILSSSKWPTHPTDTVFENGINYDQYITGTTELLVQQEVDVHIH